MLETLHSEGAPYVRNNPIWSQEQCDSVAHSMGYQSTINYLGFAEHEMVDMVQKGYFCILPYSAIRHYDDLRLSHIGVVPQKDCRPRTICDYRASGVNAATVPLTPKEAMQFGRAVDCLFHTILTAQRRYGLVYAMKHDISDGYYWVFIQSLASLSLAVVLPVAPGEEPLIAIPLALPMGWSESPPYFCMLTETVTDLSNQYAASTYNAPTHHLESLASSPQDPPPDDRPIYTESHPASSSLPHHHAGLADFDVFIDDTIGLAQGSPERLRRLRRNFLHINDLVFRPNDSSDTDRHHGTSSQCRPHCFPW